jgi:hypothetical protein
MAKLMSCVEAAPRASCPIPSAAEPSGAASAATETADTVIALKNSFRPSKGGCSVVGAAPGVTGFDDAKPPRMVKIQRPPEVEVKSKAFENWLICKYEGDLILCCAITTIENNNLR